MPSSAGPNTFGEENLVFGYDLGDSKNSFPGIPAVNCATAPESAYNWTVTEVTDGGIPPPRKGARVFKFVCNNASNLHRQGGYYNGGGFAGSNPTPLILGRTSPSNFTTVGTGKYRFGMWVRGAASNSTAWWTIDIGDRNGSTITVNNNTDWQFVSTTDAAGIASTSYPYDFFDINGTNGQTYYVADYGIFRSPGTVDSLPALQAYPQWVDYQQERSYTAGLKDLTGNSTINLTNVSFDSNAQMTFDGSNDYISLGDNSLFDFINGIGSVEAIVKFPSSWTAGSQYPNLISKGASAGWDTDGWSLFGFRSYGSGTGYTLGIGIRNTETVQTTLAYDQPADTWIHVVGTLDGSSIKIYINGTLVTTNSQTVNPGDNNTNVYIGRDPSSQYFPGDIPYVKVYSRALTASEIRANYNAIKGRFNI